MKQFSSTKERLWNGILSKLFFKAAVIEKGKASGFFVIKTDKKFTLKNETVKTQPTKKILKRSKTTERIFK